MNVDTIYVLSWNAVALAAAITLMAGFVKGAVGFAMPMIMISGLGSFMAPELALAGLIVPTLSVEPLAGTASGAARGGGIGPRALALSGDPAVDDPCHRAIRHVASDKCPSTYPRGSRDAVRAAATDRLEAPHP